jgi:polyisoprenoid-binding protein YceI
MMKSRFMWSAALVACLIAGPRSLRADDYKLDEGHTSVIFGISHMGLSLTYGRFNEVKGSYTLDAADPANSKFEFIINAQTIDTNNEGRDKHLRSADFLSADEFPTITFASTKVTTKEVDGKKVYVVAGDLTMHGVKKEVTLELTLLGEGAGPQGNDHRTGFLCDVRLKRSDFGMTKYVPNIGDEVAITISFEGVRQ